MFSKTKQTKSVTCEGQTIKVSLLQLNSQLKLSEEGFFSPKA